VCVGTYTLSQPKEAPGALVAGVHAGFCAYLREANQIHTTVDSLKANTLTNAEVCWAIMMAGTMKLVGWSTVGRVHAEYHRRGHSDANPCTCWGLLCIFNTVARPNIHPVNQMYTYNEFRKLLPCAAPGVGR